MIVPRGDAKSNVQMSLLYQNCNHPHPLHSSLHGSHPPCLFPLYSLSSPLGLCENALGLWENAEIGSCLPKGMAHSSNACIRRA